MYDIQYIPEWRRPGGRSLLQQLRAEGFLKRVSELVWMLLEGLLRGTLVIFYICYGA